MLKRTPGAEHVQMARIKKRVSLLDMTSFIQLSSSFFRTLSKQIASKVNKSDKTIIHKQ